MRINRVIYFYKIFQEAYEKQKAKDSENEKSVSTKASIRRYMKGILREAYMMREGRVITIMFVNIIVPMTIVGLSASYTEYSLIFVPLEEQDVCWFYYLQRSPFLVPKIPNWLYNFGGFSRIIIVMIELACMFYYVWFLNRFKLISSIDIQRESNLLTGQWILISFVI